ncbi:hypothetical protein PLICRDRAFT_52792 [Plicaturopsis crispa FD-325 SS-3]|nr:hypothetical protein PLICRDRAFT_52792 [Plicaturopsis crispa FD-325 SS-3]
MRRFLLVCLAAFLLAHVAAQTLTAVDPDSGATVIEVVTVDPVEGLPTTEILQTLTTTAAAGAVTGGAATGARTIGQQLITLPGATTVLQTALASGTVYDYSDWLKMVGTNTVAANAASAGERRWRVQSGWVGIGAGVLAGVGSGAWLVLV